jgi:hypothetical protein
LIAITTTAILGMHTVHETRSGRHHEVYVTVFRYIWHLAGGFWRTYIPAQFQQLICHEHPAATLRSPRMHRHRVQSDHTAPSKAHRGVLSVSLRLPLRRMPTCLEPALTHLAHQAHASDLQRFSELGEGLPARPLLLSLLQRQLSSRRSASCQAAMRTLCS